MPVTPPTTREPSSSTTIGSSATDAEEDLLRQAPALELLVLLHERDRPGAADGEEEPVDAGLRDLRDVRGVVLRPERRPDPLGDLPAERTELGDEARVLRVREVVVVTDRDDVPPLERVVGVVAHAGHPLRPVRVEPEEVRRPDLERRVLSARGAVDEGVVRSLLRVVGDRDALRARERADQDVDLRPARPDGAPRRAQRPASRPSSPSRM